MNMNLDDESDDRDLSTRVENYFLAEFVAIPPDFDIANYLSLREQAGIFKDCENVDFLQIKQIADGVRYSPVFTILNNATMRPHSCIYFLEVINELGLVLKSIHNPVRKSSGYKQLLRYYSDDEWTYVRGQEFKRLNFIIINVFNLMSEDVIAEAMCIAQNLQNYQQEIMKERKQIPNLDEEVKAA